MDESPGWAAIDGALRDVYGDVEPLHWATILKWAVGGSDPLDGISAYPRTEPVPHWHFVSYGMSELYEKESENADESGWGFEFTFRLVRDPADEKPPVWAANMLQNLGRYVFKSGNWFEPGHHMNVNGPIATDRDDSDIRAVAFVLDPELGEIGTPHGSLQFLQVVGLATAEYEAVRQWNSEALMDVLAPRLPLFVTDLDRRSLLEDPEVGRAVREGIARDGSSSGMQFVSTAHWERTPDGTTITLGALQATAVADALRGRLPFGRELILRTADTVLVFAPDDAFAVEEPDEGRLVLRVPPAALDDLADTLRPTAARRPVPSLPGLTVEIVPTVMKDQYGEETGEVIG
ncbi:suppressor of fused domain protein [Actinomadura sp. WMMB 499]|uniref:suppressor of fused domain protein n=1 Tax=Actinomadura sp. WMMB 499 TaxID=1219491 RepID=UPI00159DF9E7|nr:suppressor of fused domain protein [Actinomadura sp. WMMB 499]